MVKTKDGGGFLEIFTRKLTILIQKINKSFEEKERNRCVSVLGGSKKRVSQSETNRPKIGWTSRFTSSAETLFDEVLIKIF